ncbi:hypothetical protein [Caldanaerobius polysaccharolyticus]|uniref:hypothetical protein n=1 Tax=Caldanaerobius polysaccharolyticus TaxID=44256 RepID=UPI000479B89C|nr:hypothetical protein [Caldanaerobius polysaccharolyticus]
MDYFAFMEKVFPVVLIIVVIVVVFSTFGFGKATSVQLSKMFVPVTDTSRLIVNGSTYTNTNEKIYFSNADVKTTFDKIQSVSKPQSADLGEIAVMKYGKTYFILQSASYKGVNGTAIFVNTEREAYQWHYPYMVDLFGGGRIRPGSFGFPSVRGGGIGAGK